MADSVKITDLFRLYKASHELVHGEDDADLEAPVKFVAIDGTEFLVTELTYEVNPDTKEAAVFLTGVIDE